VWTYEHSIETAADAASLWQLYSDVTTWPAWNPAVDAVDIEGPFAAGTTGTLTPSGQTPLPFRVVAAETERSYTSETDIAETVTLRLTNSLEPLPGGGTRVTHRADLVGAAADYFGESFGPALTAGVPTSMQRLAEHALTLPVRSGDGAV